MVRRPASAEKECTGCIITEAASICTLSSLPLCVTDNQGYQAGAVCSATLLHITVYTGQRSALCQRLEGPLAASFLEGPLAASSLSTELVYLRDFTCLLQVYLTELVDIFTKPKLSVVGDAQEGRIKVAGQL